MTHTWTWPQIKRTIRRAIAMWLIERAQAVLPATDHEAICEASTFARAVWTAQEADRELG